MRRAPLATAPNGAVGYFLRCHRCDGSGRATATIVNWWSYDDDSDEERPCGACRGGVRFVAAPIPPTKRCRACRGDGWVGWEGYGCGARHACGVCRGSGRRS